MKRSTHLFSVLTSSIALICAAYLIYLSAYVPGWFNPVVLGIAVVLWLVFNQTETGLELPIFIFCGVMILVSFGSIDPRRSLEQCWLLMLGLALLQISAFTSRSISPSRVVALVLIAGVPGMGWLWLNAGAWYSAWLAAAPGHWLPEISFRLAGGNNSGAFVNVLFLTSLPFFFLTPGKIVKVLCGLYAGSALLILVLSSSRGGWVGAAAGLFTMAVLFSFRYRWDYKKLLHSRRFRWIGIGILAIAGGLFAVLGLVYFRLFANNRTHGPILESRSEFWPTGWNMFLQSPLWGKGMNTFESFLAQAYSTPPFTIFLHAHNQYLDFLSGGGMIGLGVLIYLLYHFSKQLRHRWNVSSADISPVLIGGISALVCYLVHGFFDGLYRMPDASFALVLILGASLRSETPNRRSTKWISFALGSAVVILCFYMTWLKAPVYDAVSQFENGQYTQAIQDIQVSIQRDPNLATNYQQSALMYDLQPQQDLKNAGQAMQQAVRLDPWWPLNHANLGALYRQQGQMEQAAAEFKIATSAAPRSQLFYLNLGETEELIGNEAEARQAYQKALELYPGWKSAYFWRATALRRSVLAQVEPNLAEVKPLSDIQLLDIEKNGSAAVLDMVNLAGYQIKQKEYEKAGATLKKAELMVMFSGERVELSWQEAEFLAISGQYAQAVIKAENVLDGFRQQGVDGPGSQGTFMYAQDVFKSPAIPQDLVKELTIIKYNSLWGNRLWELSTWYNKMGDPQAAQRIRMELFHEIPDFSPPNP